MIQLIDKFGVFPDIKKRYLIDTSDDLSELEMTFGNEAYCIEEKKIYICNGSGAYVEKASGGGGGGTVEWDTTVTIGFSVGTDTATIDGTTFVKTSDRYFTDEQLVGSSFHLGDGSLTITADMLIDMTPYGVDATGINLPDYGMAVFCAHSANEIIPSVGTYLVQRMSIYAPLVTLVYVEHFTAQMRPIAYGTAELEDGVSDLPTGVLYFQIGG